MLETYRVAGVEPVDVLEVSETGTLVAVVAAGLGVGLVPAVATARVAVVVRTVVG